MAKITLAYHYLTTLITNKALKKGMKEGERVLVRFFLSSEAKVSISMKKWLKVSIVYQGGKKSENSAFFKWTKLG